MSIPPPRFDANLEQTWPEDITLFKVDIDEAIQQQLLDCDDQKREAPYYNVWTATGFTYLTTIYSSTSPLRLEATAQAELPYKVKITQDERDRVRDPTFEDDDKERSPDPAQHPVLSKKEVENLKIGLTGSQWGPPKHPRRRGNVANPPKAHTPLPKAPPPPAAPAPPPPPVSTASSTAPPPPPTIYRIADGLVLRREKLDSLRKRNSKAIRAIAVPVASIEVKVPKWKKLKKSKLTNDNEGSDNKDAADEDEEEEEEEAEEEEEDNTNDDGAEPTSNDAEEEGQQGQKAEADTRVWIIDETEADKAIFGGMAQIVQQVQFIFHNWPLNVVWAVGASGRWAQFFRFDRDTTPPVDYSTISNETDDVKAKKYYSGPIPPERIPDIEATSPVFLAVNDDGSFTEEFKTYWRRVIEDAENEFIRMEGLARK